MQIFGGRGDTGYLNANSRKYPHIRIETWHHIKVGEVFLYLDFDRNPQIPDAYLIQDLADKQASREEIQEALKHTIIAEYYRCTESIKAEGAYYWTICGKLLPD